MMKVLFKTLIVFAVITSFASCDRFNAITGTGKTQTITLTPSEQTFLSEAYSSALYAVQLSREACVRSISYKTKELAEKVKAENEQFATELRHLAEAKGAAISYDLNNEQKTNWLVLVKKRRWEFDEAYTRLINEAYHQRFDALAAVAAHGKDDGIKLTIQKIEPVFQQTNRYSQEYLTAIVNRDQPEIIADAKTIVAKK